MSVWLTASELLHQPVQVQLSAVRDERVALESVDVNACNRDLGPGRRDAAELTGMGTGEPASRDAVGTVDENLFDDVSPVREAASELLEIRTPFLPTERLRAADLDNQTGRHQLLERRPVPPVQGGVEALHQFPDGVIVRLRHEPNDIYPRTLAMIVSAKRSIGSR